LNLPIDFILFGLTLLGVALFHRYVLQVALIGLGVIIVYKLGFTGFKTGPGIGGLALHMAHEWVILANLLGLLLGFALLSNHFERSKVPEVLPHYLPDDWKGGFLLLVIVFVLSSFLDNIAAALIGGTMAAGVFRSNAGGAGSVVGDTTTTMMWIDGVSPISVLHAYVAAGVALLVCAIPAALQQQRYAPITKDARVEHRVDWMRIAIVGAILLAAIGANVLANLRFPTVLDHFPVIGAAVWVAIVLTAFIRRPDWGLLPDAFKGSIFLLALVTCASLMPVEKLPPASWHTTFGLGFISAVFDNIPLTALALKQGGYDWGMLAYAVGYGGSMIWFGSSAGVAISNMYPQAKSVGQWVRHGWHVALAYVVGFLVMLALLGWHPTDKRGKSLAASCTAEYTVGADCSRIAG
jgi:Na+/H+ antiporter NhaD/arsenite permease-like protein